MPFWIKDESKIITIEFDYEFCPFHQGQWRGAEKHI
jgi:hypothetical protein